MSRITHWKTAALKAGIVLIPAYLAAYLTDKMAWVVPTLAASSFFAATIGLQQQSLNRRVDEDHGDDQADDTQGAADADQGAGGTNMAPLDGG